MPVRVLLVSFPVVVATVVVIVSLPYLREMILIEEVSVVLLLINKDCQEKHDELNCNCKN